MLKADRNLVRALRPLLVAIGLLSAGEAIADDVVPSDRVVSGVHVRRQPASSSTSIDILEPGERLTLIEPAGRWYKVKLPDGRVGYVSRAWTMVETTPEPEPLSPTVDGPPPTPSTESGSTFTVHAIDVGTGLAILVEGADFTLLYDGGSNDDLARGDANRLLAYLRHIRPDLTQIDHLVLSHPHRDHVELLPDLFDSYAVRHVWDSGAVNPICGYRAFLRKIADEPDVSYHDASGLQAPLRARFERKSCYGESWGPETIEIDRADGISPAPVPLGAEASMVILHADAGDHGDFNENTVVARLALGSVSVLLAGDAEGGGRQKPQDPPEAGSVEQKLIECCAAALTSNILIVGHHGSKTSSRAAFLDEVRATMYVVSSGPKRYGSVTLPDNDVIEELERRGAVWRTNVSDSACATFDRKIGPDADGRAGGCDNVRIEISADGHFSATYFRPADE